MREIILWYNRKRKIIWKTIGVIVIAFIALQVLRYLWEKSIEIEDDNIIASSNNTKTELNSINLEENKSAVTRENISNRQKNSLKVLDQFIEYCNNGNINEAYNLLSEDCKSQMYPTIEYFKNSYFDKMFKETKKNVSIENWVGNIYKVDFLEDALSTGIYNTQNVIQDYITIVQDENKNTKININNYIGKKKINIQKNNTNLDIKVIEKHMYMDYEIYSFEIKNNTNKIVLLDNLKNIETMYLNDKNNLKYPAYTHELSEAELLLNSKESRKLNIKYYNKYSSSRNIKSIIFSKIILDYKTYEKSQNISNYSNYDTIKISL